MTARAPAKKQRRSRQSNLLAIFGPAPILEHEDAAAYDALIAEVSSAVNPTDVIEDIFVRDIVDLTWEIFRSRRLKANLLSDSVPYHLGNILAPLVNKSPAPIEAQRSVEPLGLFPLPLPLPPPTPPSLAHKLARKWANHDPAAIKRVEKLVASRKLSMDDVFARVFMDKFDEIERIDRFTMITEERRNSVFREIDRRRASFVQTQRGTVKEIDNMEFQTIEPKTIALRNPAIKNTA